MKPVVKKLSAMLLSLAMVVSLTPIPGGLLLADETDAATPTTVGDTEPEEKKDPEKPAAEKSKETAKPAETAPKETKKPEAEEPKEPEKQETEAPAEKETTETEAPKETEKPAEEAPAETEKPEAEQPKETEAPAETEKPAEETPDATEPETETPEMPEETVPGESDAKDSQKVPFVETDINNVKCENGILTWDKVTSATQYEVKISGSRFYTTSCTYNIGKEIEKLIQLDQYFKSSSYYVCLYAYDKSGNCRASWKNYISYETDVVFTMGTITDLKIENGTLTWTKYPNASFYYVVFNENNDDCWSDEIYANSYNLNNAIDKFIENEYLDPSSTGDYEIKIIAKTKDWDTIATAKINHNYKSTSTPVKIGKITNPKITDGVLTWDAYTGASKYYIDLTSGWGKLTDKTELKIGDVIDELIASGAMDKSNNDKYWVQIAAYDSKDKYLAYFYGYLTYETTASEPAKGEIQNARISSTGTLSWNAYPGATEY